MFVLSASTCIDAIRRVDKVARLKSYLHHKYTRSMHCLIYYSRRHRNACFKCEIGDQAPGGSRVRLFLQDIYIMRFIQWRGVFFGEKRIESLTCQCIISLLSILGKQLTRRYSLLYASHPKKEVLQHNRNQGNRSMHGDKYSRH